LDKNHYKTGTSPFTRPTKDFFTPLRFSSLSGIRPMIERYPLEKAAAAFEQMISGKARFRVVLTMGA